MTETISIEGVRVCAAEDVPLGEGRTVIVAGRPLAVFRTDDGFFALDNTCTHMGGPLADGIVADETVACPLHDRRFELATGRAVGHECGGVAAYPVEGRDGEIFVTMPLLEGAASDESRLATGAAEVEPAEVTPTDGESPAGNTG
ncbi:MAG: nitrite reductase small subunit NirD [Thermoleophilaceae bacterium]|nr:nitrite reductase small subunit NirD [Thermoleophilaceae bacterium]